MPRRLHWWLLFFGLVLLACPRTFFAQQAPPPAVGAELKAYVGTPDAAFQWKLESNRTVGEDRVTTLHLVSQVWHGETWEHKLQIYQPKNAQPTKTLLLWNTGGEPKPGDMLMGMNVARLAGAPVAFLYGVPKQPLFGGLKEDALIAETYVRFLESKDPTWPLLFPMVKSVVRAMDALQEFTKKEWPTPVENFVIAGASKRGWTTWLTAGTGDPRVKAIVPVVIDTLNMQKQLPHQLEMFGGKYSEQIRDYTERKLAPMPDTPEARKLVSMVDPWFYRGRFNMPKLILNGANDPYWAVDALNNYWDDLPGPKWVTYVPNAGHNLQQDHGNGKKDSSAAMNALAAFYRHILTEKPLPRLSWRFNEKDGEKGITLQCKPWPKRINHWLAECADLDFRPARWQLQGSVEAKSQGENHEHSYSVAQRRGNVAFFLQCDYEIDGIPYSLCTQLQVQRGNQGPARP